ncbi:hypothetical protein ACFLV7_11810 [Chloroflexota bacterium]
MKPPDFLIDLPFPGRGSRHPKNGYWQQRRVLASTERMLAANNANWATASGHFAPLAETPSVSLAYSVKAYSVWAYRVC